MTTITLPSDLAHLALGDKKCEFWLLQGVGLAENVWSETNIGSSRNGYNQLASVHSSSTTKREFWIGLQSGKEKKISLPDNSSFAVREGHQLSLICMQSKVLSPDSYYYMGVVNHTTDRYISLDNTWMLRKLAGTNNGLTQGLANSFVLVTLGLGLILLELYSRSLTARYLKPMSQRVDDITSHCFKHGFQVSKKQSIVPEGVAR